MNKYTLNEYINMNWDIHVSKSNDDGIYFIATINEMPGLIATGSTKNEAITNAHSALKTWLQRSLELNRNIQLPN